DADGLISDCDFTGLQDNYIFFNKEKPNPVGFEAKMKGALDLATSQGYASKRVEMMAHDLDFAKLKKMTELKEDLVLIKPSPFTEGDPKGTLKPIYSFTISFEPDKPEFSVEKYGADFQRAVELSKLYGDAIIEIRGHADGTNLVKFVMETGLSKGTFK